MPAPARLIAVRHSSAARCSSSWPVAAAAFTIPVAVFLLAVWALQVRPHHLGHWHTALVPATAVLVLASTLAPEPILATGLLVAAMIGIFLAALHRPAAGRAP